MSGLGKNLGSSSFSCGNWENWQVGVQRGLPRGRPGHAPWEAAWEIKLQCPKSCSGCLHLGRYRHGGQVGNELGRGGEGVCLSLGLGMVHLGCVVSRLFLEKASHKGAHHLPG